MYNTIESTKGASNPVLSSIECAISTLTIMSLGKPAAGLTVCYSLVMVVCT